VDPDVLSYKLEAEKSYALQTAKNTLANSYKEAKSFKNVRHFLLPDFVRALARPMLGALASLGIWHRSSSVVFQVGTHIEMHWAG